MKTALVIDFGSTYTKLTAVDLDGEKILGTSQAYTTVETDVANGLSEGIKRLKESIGSFSISDELEKSNELDAADVPDKVDGRNAFDEFDEIYACSSAAGGLRMMASGLVPELTAEVAKAASLGAGAKVLRTFAYELTEDDLDYIKEESPDIFLLAGGTDGGNQENIMANATHLASINPGFPIIIAGNRNAARKCEEILAGFDTYICPNIMPKLGVVETDQVRAKIREIFLSHIVKAKGMTEAQELISEIIMPTPAAVLSAMELLATDIGELMGVDVGGATTDVYSIAKGAPLQASTVLKGIPEPYAKRTVEGDIGMRYSIYGILDAAGVDRIAEISGLSPSRVEELVEVLSKSTDKLPDGDHELESLDRALATMAIKTAIARHAGTMEETYTPMGRTFVQTGKDLTNVENLVVTGGSVIHMNDLEKSIETALRENRDPASLIPVSPKIWVDKKYILAAMGLLSTKYPKTALKIMKEEVTLYG